MADAAAPDAAARARALAPTRSFLVQAPAGSGKTELLTDRILALLATVERPEDIVAITFTRKAAAEMHERVLTKLAQARNPDPPAEPQRLRSWQLARRVLARDAEKGWALLAHPARLGVRTIDAFCASLVRRMPWLSELGGMPSVAEDATSHYEAAAQATLQMAGDSADVRALLAHLDVDWRAARAALAQMLAARDQWLALLALGDDRATLERALGAAVGEQLQALAAALPAGWGQALAQPARLAAAVLDEALETKNADNPLAALRDWDGRIDTDIDADIDATDADSDTASLPRWRALAHLLLTGKGELRSPKGVTAKLGFPPKSAHKNAFIAWLEAQHPEAEWCARLAALTTTPAPRVTDAQWRILGAQLAVLRLAAAQLTVRFAQTGEVDFIDIAQRAARALGTSDAPGELLLALDAGIRHILIDEFQDTSQAQIALLSVLTAGWQPDDGRTLFLVGDPMQSIYRFRKAEVGLFLQVRDAGIGDLKPEFLQLTQNFRSQAGIVDWVNRVFGALFPATDDAATGAIRYAPSTAFKPALADEAVQVHAVWAGPQADAQTEEAAVQLARQAYAAGKSVAILVRARSHVGALTQRLAHARVPYRAVELTPLAQRCHIIDLTQLTRALAHPGDRMAWLSVLRAPWCGLTLASLTQLFGADHHTPIPVLLARALAPGGVAEALAADERLRLQWSAAVLLDADNAAGSLPFAAWVESMWTRLGGPMIYPGSDCADAQSFFRLLERIAPYGALDTARLAAELQRLYATPDATPGATPDAAPAAQSPAASAAVDVMTMHKAKGLQFDVVILFGLHRLPRASTAPLVRFEHSAGRVLMAPIKPRAEVDADPLSAYLAAREQARADFELDRLLYVAATRARERLHLIGVVQPDKKTAKETVQARAPSVASLLGRLWPHLAVPPPAGVPETAGTIDPTAAPLTGVPLRRLRLEDLHHRPAAPPQHDAPPLAAAAFQLLHPDVYDALTGTVAHAWLARIGTDGLAAWPMARLDDSASRIGRQLARAGVPDAHLATCTAEVLETLRATLASARGRWLLGLSHARREWPLIDSDGQVAVIDLALAQDDGWLIVDYKTARPHPRESPADFACRMRTRHGAQLERYCRHVALLAKRPVRAALYCPRADAWLELDQG